METKIENKNEMEVAGNSPAEMIRLAVNGGADLDKLEKLLNIQERWEANEARKAFHRAMSEFKANAPKVGKDKTVSYKTEKGAVNYNHATLANVVDTVSPILSKYGLSVTWKTQQNGQIGVTCKITHVDGHFEEVTLFAPADNSGLKNSIQAIGSTVTYLQRYTFLAITGLATEEQDDDGVAADLELIDEQQLSALLDLIASTRADAAKFLKYMGLESLEKMPKNQFQKAVAALKAKEKKR